MKSLWKKVLGSLLAAVMGIGLFVGCAPASASAASYVSLSINPGVEFTVNQNDVVLTVNCLNEDAEVLLADIDLVGWNIQDATEKFVDLAVAAGYISTEDEDNEVVVTVVGKDLTIEDRIKTRIKERVHNYFDNNGIYGRVSDETLEAFAEQAAELGVSRGKMKMMLLAIELNPELTMEAAEAMTMMELMTMIREKHQEMKGIMAQHRQGFRTELAALREEFAEMFTLGGEIEALEAQLTDETLDEETKAGLEATLAQKQTRFDELKVDFMAQRQALIDQYKEEGLAIREQMKTQMQARRDAVRDELAQHRQEMQQKRQEMRNQIQQWRNQFQN